MFKKYLLSLIAIPIFLCGYNIPEEGLDYSDTIKALDNNETFEISPRIKTINDTSVREGGINTVIDIDTSRVNFGTPGDYDISFTISEAILPEYIKLHGIFAGVKEPKQDKIVHTILTIDEYEETAPLDGIILEETEEIIPEVNSEAETAEVIEETQDPVSLDDPVSIDMGNGNEIVVDNSSTGRLVIGDSRTEQLYMYGSTKASFVAVWGGNYYGWTSLSINTNDRINTMRTFANNAREATGGCKIYIMSTVNDYDGGEYYQSAANDILSLAEQLKDCGDIYIVDLIGMKNVDVSAYNAYIKTEAQQRGFQVISIGQCLAGNNGGYLSDDLHYTEETIANIWTAILQS